MISGFRRKQAARQMLRLLAQQRQLLISGRISATVSLRKSLERAANALEVDARGDDPQMMEMLVQIRSAAAHNQTLADAARRGLKMASRLRSEAADAGSALQTYTGNGHLRRIAMQRGTQDRRT